MANHFNTFYIKRVALLVYLILLIWILLFSHTPPFNRTPTHFQEIQPQLIPLGSIIQFASNKSFNGNIYFLLSNVIGNVVLFIPYGFLLSWIFLFFTSYARVALFTFLMSLTAELLQYVLHLGVFDVDDLLLNTLGGIAGHKLFLFWQKKETT